ncbi:hypothetical protein KJ840_02320 [Patescibacteria group bacterium]|nr:hypothetical protein [Patescibacteria group bacterium]
MKNKNVIITIFVIIVIIIISVLATNKKGQDNNNLNNNTAVLLNFQSSSGRLFLEYPASYGNVNEKIKTVANSSGSVMAGQAASITFSDNLNVYVNRASMDYKPFLDDFYSGVKNFDELCGTSEIDNLGNGCVIKKIGDHQVLEQTQYLTAEGTYILFHLYSIKLTDNDGYSGLLILQNFPEIYNRLNKNLTQNEIYHICQTEAESILNRSNDVYNKSIDEIERIIASMKL